MSHDSPRNEPFARPHQLTAFQFVRLAPCQQPHRAKAEVLVGGLELARVEAGLGREAVTQAGVTSASDIAVAVPSMRTRSRVGPRATRTLPVAIRLRLVGLDAGVEITSAPLSHKNDNGIMYGVPPSAVATHASTSCSSRSSESCLRCSGVRGGAVIDAPYRKRPGPDCGSPVGSR